MKPPLPTLLALVLLAALAVAPEASGIPGVTRARGPVQGLRGFGSTAKVAATLYHRVEEDRVEVALELVIEPRWHLYHDDLGHPEATGLPTVVELAADGVEWGPARFPEPHRYDQSDLVDGAWINGHEGTIVVYALGRAAGDVGRVTASLEGLTCQDDGSCIPYQDEVASAGRGPDALFAAFPGDLGLERPAGDPDDADASGTGDPGSGAAAASAAPPAAERDYDAVTFGPFRPQTQPPRHGLVAWILLAFVAGMLLNVMPCVLPVISIKVLSFVQQAGEDRRRVLQLGLAFAAGIVVVFLALAGLAIGAGLSWGEQFQSQAFLVVMIAIVFALALSLFGLFDLGVPTGVGAMAGAQREGLGDAFFKGMLATVLATPCSGPFLGTTLTWTLAQTPLTVVAVFLSLGLGMALPYVVLTANPALLRRLPKPGPWMETFKQAMGFVLLATVIYLMVSLRQDLLLFTAAFLVFVALGCWWWGRFASLGQSPARRWATLAFALLIVAGGAQLSFGSFRALFAGAEAETELGWRDFDPWDFEERLARGESVFVDFTADWCPNCKWNEKFVYESDEAVAGFAAKGVVRYKADITHDDPETRAMKRLMRELGASSIPFAALFPGDRPDEPYLRWDIVGKDDFVGLIDALPRPD